MDLCLLFNMLSRFVIAFLPRSKHLLISCCSHHLQWFLEPQKIKSATVSPSICHLFLISSASVTFIPFSVLYCAHFYMKSSLGISNFLEKICSLSHSIVFLYCLHWSLRKAFLSLLAILWNSAFKQVYLPFSPLSFTSLVFKGICKASSDNHFAFLPFFFLGMVLITAFCTMSRTSFFSSSGTLSDLIPWIYLSFLPYNFKGFDLGHTWMV